MAKKLIRIDKNGTKYYEGMIPCDRCGGRGLYATGVCNGHLVITPVDSGICHKCFGSGKVFGKWVERTPEYQAKLDAKRQAKLEKQWAEEEARIAAEEMARKEAEAQKERERLEEEARIKAQKAISKHIGEVGQRLTIAAEFVKTAWFDVPSFRGFGTDTVYVHTFKDAAGNVLIWKTGKGLGGLDLHCGELVEIIGTIKDHSEYQEEKQTVLTRCKITRK